MEPSFVSPGRLVGIASSGNADGRAHRYVFHCEQGKRKRRRKGKGMRKEGEGDGEEDMEAKTKVEHK